MGASGDGGKYVPGVAGSKKPRARARRDLRGIGRQRHEVTGACRRGHERVDHLDHDIRSWNLTSCV
eukprot:13328069-Alexandrium_andersonii.AAC.1